MQAPTSAWMRIGELSRRVNVSVDTLRAWERRYGLLRPRRTSGNTRLYTPLDEARVKLMKRHIADDLPAAQAAELALSTRLTLRAGERDAVPAHECARAIDELDEALERFDETAAERTLHQLLRAYALTAVLRDLVIPFMHRAGERWACGDMSVAQEHFATSFLLSRLSVLSRGWDHGLGPRALLAAGPADFHTLGLLTFGIALHATGWRITCLGAATPVAMLASAAEATACDLIVVSTSVDGGLDDHVPALRGLAGLWRLAIGGPAADPELAFRCGAAHLDADPVSAARMVALT